MKLEKYLDTAEAEVKAFQKSIDDMDSYEGCQAGFSSLVSSYTHRALAAFRGSLGSCKDSANLSGTVWCSASSMFKAHRPKGVRESWQLNEPSLALTSCGLSSELTLSIAAPLTRPPKVPMD